ncbi:MAG: SseB family protein [Oscillospiraceae bacterium]
MITLENEKLIEAIERFHERKNDATFEKFVKQVFLAKFIVPVEDLSQPVEDGVLTKDTTFSMKMLTNETKKSYFMAFTDWEQFERWSKTHKDVLVLTYGDLMAMLNENNNNGDIVGAVINPFGGNMIVTPELLKYAKI